MLKGIWLSVLLAFAAPSWGGSVFTFAVHMGSPYRIHCPDVYSSDSALLACLSASVPTQLLYGGVTPSTCHISYAGRLYTSIESHYYEEFKGPCYSNEDQSLVLDYATQVSVAAGGSICPPPFIRLTSSQCVAYCPPDKPELDKSTGQCIAPEDNACPAKEGNPILVSTAEKIQYEPADFSQAKPFPLTFSRNYRSQRAPEANLAYENTVTSRFLGGAQDVHNFYLAPSVGFKVHYSSVTPVGYKTFVAFGAPSTAPTHFGVNPIGKRVHAVEGVMPDVGYKQWGHNHIQYFFANADETTITIIDANDKQTRFTLENGQTSRELPGVGALLKRGNNWEFSYDKNTADTYSAEGNLVERQVDGISHYYSYEQSSDLSYRLVSVRHQLGGEILLSYNADEHLSRVLFPDNRGVQYQYGAFGNLISVDSFYRDAGVDQVQGSRLYHYEDTRHPYALTGITDKTGNRYVSWVYDEYGRAVESDRHGAEHVRFDYADSFNVKVTNGLNKDTIYHYETISGAKRLVSVEGQATETCAAANKNYTYTPNGLVRSKTDWNFVKTEFEYDAFARVIAKIVAVGTPQEVRTETQWHPSLNLPVLVRTPTMETLYTYDDQGRLLSEINRQLAQ